MSWSQFEVGAHSLGPGVVERGVELGEHCFELLMSGPVVVDNLLPFPPVGAKAGQIVKQTLLGTDGSIERAFGQDHMGSRGVDGGVVVSAPPAPGGLTETLRAVGDCPFGLLAVPDQTGELTASLAPLVGPVDRYGGVELVDPFDGGGAGVAELVDTEGERVVGSDACGYDVGPVVVELFV